MSGVRRISPLVEAAVVQAYAAGTSAGALAKTHGLNRKTITTMVRRSGGTVLDQRAASGRPMIESMTLANRAHEMYSAGASNAEISRALGFCLDVVRRMLRSVGVYRANPAIRGEKHGSWKGGVVRTGQGYLAERITPEDVFYGMAARSGYVLQHRIVMAKSVGRALRQTETVHHINGDKTDNRIENLQLRQGKHGRGEVLVCGHCGSHNIIHKDIE